MFDLIHMLEYLEGQSIVQQTECLPENDGSQKIVNKYVKDPVDK